MSFFATNNQIRVVNPQANIVFDTNNKMPVIIGSFSGGAFYRGIYDEDINTHVGWVPAGADFLFPTFTFAAVKNPIFPAGIPISAPGQSIVTLTVAGGSSLFSISTIGALIVNNQVILRKKGRIESTGGVSVNYRIYVGKYV